MPIKISFLADVKSFLKGTEDVEKSLEEVDDSLLDFAKDADKATERVEKSLSDLAKEAKQAGSEAEKGLGDGYKRGTKEAENALDEFKSEANSTARESAASFDGSAESIVDSFQEIAANAFAGFGPAGAIAGLALAAGIGIATAEFQKTEEAAQKSKERVQELGKQLIESADDSSVKLENLVENLTNIAVGSEDAAKSFKDIKKEAEDLGLEVGALATAYAGGEDAIDGQIAAIQDLIEEQSKQFSEGTDGEKSRSQAGLEHIEQLQNTQKELQAVADETAAAQEAEQAWLNSGGAEMVAKQGMIDAVNTSYDDLAGSVEDFVNQETGLFDTAAYITAMQEREQALKDYQETLATSGLSTDAMNFLNEQGVEAASQMLAGYQSASPETKKELDRIWSEAAKTASGSVDTELDKTIKKGRTAKIEAQVDAAEAEKALDRVIRDRSAVIKLDFQDRNGKRIY